MPIKTPGGILEVEDAKLRASYLLANTSVGIGTSTTVPDGASLYIKEDNPTIRLQEADTSAARILAKSGTLRIESGTNYGQPEHAGDIAFSNIQGVTTHMIIKGDGNVGIGMTDPGHNLDIVSEMNLRSVSNTASIKYNSNVVTEYVRSKKFMKFPRVAMTAASTGGYTASASDVLSGTYPVWKAFDNTIDGNDGYVTPAVYDTSTGEATTSATSFNNQYGEYIDLQLPDAIKVSHFIIKTREGGTYTPEDSPGEGYLYGSNDGSNWTELTSFSGLTYGGMTTNGNTYEEVQVNATGFYSYLRLQLTKRAGQFSSDAYVAIGELEYYGTPEYDPEAHGTDVIMRSVPNVPNTDWLEVYYDGKSYTSKPTSVSEESGQNSDATIDTNVGFDTTWKAFTFDASGDTINGTHGLSGTNPPHTIGGWFKRNAVRGSYDYLFTIGTSTSGQMSGFTINSSKLNFSIYSNQVYATLKIRNDTWYHVMGVFDASKGDVWDTSTSKIYINGLEVNTDSSGNSSVTLNLTGTQVTLGANTSAAEGFDGSIANFKLFNRVLTSDEIWDLYAEQKEYFNSSPNSLTFKNGRLGIGISEPSDVLHVRGGVSCDMLVLPNYNTSSSNYYMDTIKTGALRYNEETNKVQFYTSLGWISIGATSGEGGDVVTVSGEYKIHIFENSGDFVVTGSGLMDYMLVGGGGSGGGGRHGGGGGAGAVVHQTSQFINSGTYTITVGGGASSASTVAIAGGDTTASFTSAQALGGGGGGCHPVNDTKNEYGQDGGCGGGAGHNASSSSYTASGYSRSSIAVSPAFGFDGAVVLNRSATGGGGGAGGNGQTGTGGETATSGTGGAGGIGYQTDISGTTLYWAGGGGGSASPNNTGSDWIGGQGGNGGGGGGAVGSNGSGAAGGTGGSGYNTGGNGTKTVTSGQCDGGNGGVNTGGGGGGAGGWSTVGNGVGGQGGKGIVIIRYRV